MSLESLKIQDQWAEIKIRAERRGGEILKEQSRQPGETDKKIMSQAETLSPKLSEIGISRSQASRWQASANIPEETFKIAV